VQVISESGEEREFVCALEQDKLKVSMQVADDETLRYECYLNANGEAMIQKTDDGYGESCFKQLRHHLANIGATEGLRVMDEHGHFIESSPEPEATRQKDDEEDLAMEQEWNH
jgi:hypothetical protein